MLSIDEAIAMLKFNNKHIADLGNDDLQQIAEWLEQLKDYQDKNKMVVRVDVENMDSIKDKIEELSKYAERQYNKALNDFVNACEKRFTTMYGQRYVDMRDIVSIAEQLKEGAKNDD